MAYTGFDPFGPQDPSGGGLDPSFYYAVSPGGRFPGDVEAYLEWRAAQSRGTAGGDPDYDNAGTQNLMNKIPGAGGKFLQWLAKFHANNQAGGEGQSPDLPGGYPYHFFSGPAAQFGPPGGPLHGLVDQGRTSGGTWDQDRPGGDLGGNDDGKKKGGGGGGSNFGPLTLQPYQWLNHKSSFVDWQPTQPFSGSSGPTRFVQGQGSSFPSAQPPAGGTPGPGLSGGGKGKGKDGAGGGKGKKNAGGKNGDQKTGPGQKSPLDELMDMLFSGPGLGTRGNAQRFGAPGGAMREGMGAGVNPNNLDMGTPGWMRDPTAGVNNTGGFPNPTPSAPRPGESYNDYMTRLHDQGFGTGDILSMLGPNGYRQNGAGDWEWGWGTGPVVRDESGYHFANQQPGSRDISGNYGMQPWGGGGAGGATGGGATGGGGVGRNWNATAGDWLLGGVTGAPSY